MPAGRNTFSTPPADISLSDLPQLTFADRSPRLRLVKCVPLAEAATVQIPLFSSAPRVWRKLTLAVMLGSATSSMISKAEPIPVPDSVDLRTGIAYGTGGGQPLLLDLATPKVPAAQPRPAIVFIHGGGWSGSDRTNGHRIILLLASQGFVAASIDYRLSGVAPFPAQLEDSKCAVRYLRAHAKEYGVDPQRIGAAGGSAGGHLAALVGLMPKSAGLEGSGGGASEESSVSAVCDLYGVSDLTALVSECKLTGGVQKLMRATPKEKPELYRQASPLAQVRAGAPPFYLAHGDKDETVPLSQSQRLAEALQKVGTEATVRVIPGMGHGSISTLPPEVLTDVVAFFQKHLGPLPLEKH